MRSAKGLWGSTKGSVAPTVALSLVALIAVGGVAFDYARMASLDTELQQAADQAALAAVTQLDGSATAIARATAAAQNLIRNDSLFANKAGDTKITVPTANVTFYTSWDSATDTGTATTDPTLAKVVQVQVSDRRANFALTSFVGAARSGDISAQAVAGMSSAICKVPPVMICNPAEPTGNTNKNLAFDADGLAGHGLQLVTVGNGPSAWAPGNFGYLDTGSSTSNPNVELRQALGWTTAPGDCSGLSGVKTRTGAGTVVTQALNTRFDMYEKANVGNGNNASCPTGSSCPPSINSIKDVVMKGAPANGQQCGFANNEWELPTKQYLPTSATANLDLTDPAVVPDAMGHPRDKCHAISINGSCSYGGATPSKIGDGDWDRNAYFKVNYNWDNATWRSALNSGVASARITTATPTRYQVYNWEVANRNSTISTKTILALRSYGSGGSARRSYPAPICSALQSPSTSGVVPGGTNVDRRRISAAVINCNAWNVHGGGGTVYGVLKWVEFFLVEPSLARPRTDVNDVYVEIIGETKMGAGATAGQVVRRDKPYLIK